MNLSVIPAMTPVECATLEPGDLFWDGAKRCFGVVGLGDEYVEVIPFDGQTPDVPDATIAVPLGTLVNKLAGIVDVRYLESEV